jgi:hypothetical protein
MYQAFTYIYSWCHIFREMCYQEKALPVVLKVKSAGF